MCRKLKKMQKTQSAKLIAINLNSGGRKAMRVYITNASFNIILLYQLQHPKNLSTQQTASDTTKFNTLILFFVQDVKRIPGAFPRTIYLHGKMISTTTKCIKTHRL